MPWYRRFRPILPILFAEVGLWLGFGAVMPILPLWISSQGIDYGTLGLIVAAWPLARLVAEPVFGWIADRRDRRKLMIGGIIATALVVPLPLFVSGAPAFFVLRFLAGAATAAYDPSARGYIIDSVDPHERGHAFGLFATAQMGGFILGPAIGAVGAAATKAITGSDLASYAFPFLLCTVALVVAAVPLAIATRRAPHRAAADDAPEPAAPADHPAPASLANRILIGAMVMNLGALLASGTYEVIWSLWMQSLGADLGLIGFSFTIFGIGTILVAPFAGKLIDRSGPLRFVIIGSIIVAIAASTYPLIGDPWVVTFLSTFEGAGIAVAGPALYTIVGRGTPVGRSSTAQGLFGAAGTAGFIIASLVAGRLFEIARALPFYVMVGAQLATLVIGLVIGGRALAGQPKRTPAPSLPALAANE